MSYPTAIQPSFQKTWTRNLAVIAYIDLLFFPYFQVIIIPLSLPLILVGIMAIGKVAFPPKTITPIFIVSILMVASMLIGSYLPDSTHYLVENFKRVMQFLTSFLYLSFFFSVAKQHPIESDLKVISWVFCAYFLVMLAWFFFEPAIVNAIMSQAYGRLVTAEEVVLEHFRFAYLFSDPNTAGYFLLIVVLPWVPLCNNSVARTILVALCVIGGVFTQSRGVLLATISAIFMWLFQWRWLLFRFRKRDLWGVLKLSVVFSLVAFNLIYFIAAYFGDINIFRMSLDRVSDVESYKSGGLRFDLWRMYITELTPFPLGRGYIFDTLEGQFTPHSDILRFIFSYGFIAAGLFIWWFVRNCWKFPLLLMPALMAFSINTLIDEQKLFGLFLATLGVLLGIRERRG